jgi:hypothetical protein
MRPTIKPLASGAGLARELLVATGIVVVAGSLVTAGLGRAAVGLPTGAAEGATGPVLPAPATTAALALAAQVDTNLGLAAPASRTVEHVTDAASGQVLDEVTDLDAAGLPIGISRFDSAGGLVSSIRLGFVTQGGPTIAAAAAGSAAQAILARVGIVPGAVTPAGPSVGPRAAGGWLVRWTRLVGSVPVPGDGIVVQLDPGGSFHGVARTQHGLAPLPASTIGTTQVRSLAGARLDTWLAAVLRDEATIATVALAWVVPNDTFGDPIPAGSPSLLRLAWVVRVTTTGSLADSLGGLELAFDAGSGAPLGGDVLE